MYIILQNHIPLQHDRQLKCNITYFPYCPSQVIALWTKVRCWEEIENKNVHAFSLFFFVIIQNYLFRILCLIFFIFVSFTSCPNVCHIWNNVWNLKKWAKMVHSWCKIELVLCWFDIMFSNSLLKYNFAPSLKFLSSSWYMSYDMSYNCFNLGTQDEDEQNKNTIVLDTTMRKRTQTT